METQLKYVPLEHRQPITSPETLARALYKDFEGETREKVVVAVMNEANCIIGLRMVAYGSTTGCMFPLREIIHATLVADGVAFAIAHNHPSGNPVFSAPDIEVSRRLHQAAQTVGLRFVDHLVIAGRGCWASYWETKQHSDPGPLSDRSPINDCAGAAKPNGVRTEVVRIAVEGGIAFPVEVPAGISVEIVDLDEPDVPEDNRAEVLAHGISTQQGPYRDERYMKRIEEVTNERAI